VQSQPEISRCVEELSVISVAAERLCGWIDTWATGLMKFPAYLPAFRSNEHGFPGSSPGQAQVKPGMTEKGRRGPVSNFEFPVSKCHPERSFFCHSERQRRGICS
jgi:hypothetical protein